MLFNYVKIAIRNVLKFKTQALINLIGLSLGLTACILVFLLVQYFTSFDTHHSNFERIYRIVRHTQTQNNQEDFGAGIPVPLPDALRTDFPELEAVVHTTYYVSGLVSVPTPNAAPKLFEESEGIAHVDPEFFQVFDWDAIAGNLATALVEPNTVVITENLAKKYFQRTDVLGKTLELDGELTLKITGVVKPQPETTDFPFTFMVSNNTWKAKRMEQGWGSIWSDDQCYILLPASVSPQSVNESFAAFEVKHLGEEDAQEIALSLQPLSEVHYDGRYGNYSYSTISKANLWGLIAVGFFLLFTSCINFVNLSTAVASKRSKEVGVRKILGSQRHSLMQQFLSETAMLVILATLLSIGFAELCIGELNELLDIHLAIRLLSDWYLLSFLIALPVVVIFAAGFYPAILLSSYAPLKAIRNQYTAETHRGMTARKTLVTLQFVVSQFFIIGVLIVLQQVEYFKSSDMGFQKEGILLVDFPKADAQKANAFKQHALQHSAVRSVSLANAAPASGSLLATNVFAEVDSAQAEYQTTFKTVDSDFLTTYDIKLIAGQNLEDVDTLKQLLVNERFVKLLGAKAPNEVLGKLLRTQGKTVPIVGVVRDFHTHSLHDEGLPLMLFTRTSNYHTAGVAYQFGKEAAVKQHLAAMYTQLFPEYTFEPQHFDQEIAEFYETEEIMAKLLKAFGLVAILISCLGLFGLVSFIVQLKTKEIGIRKVLGASKKNLLLLFSSSYLKLLFLAFCIAAPAGWWIGTQWLQEFAYRIELHPGLFALALVANLLIAVATASYHSLKTIQTNPAKVLKSE